MTWRAFIIGLACVIGLCLLDPYTSFNKSYGWNTVGHFPTGPAFLLVVLTVGGNLLLKLIRRRWAFRQSELMLIWCMLIVSCITPSDGMMRLWLPAMAGPPYLARRPDIAWRDTSLRDVPETLILSKDPKSLAAEQYFTGRREEGRIPWGQWLTPISRWSIMLIPFFLATFFLFAILRKQWVEMERLQFPLARVPLEFTAGSAEGGLLPQLFSNRAFLAGLIFTFAFRFLRALPLFVGAEQAWSLTVPFEDVLKDTPLENLHMANVGMWWNAVGFAYLVPADVSLSVWFFYLFGRLELQTAAWYGSPLHYGGTWSDLMTWQLSGSYLIFTLGALYMARRHLAVVFRRALGIGARVDDSEEPVSYKLAFWGFIVCTIAVVAWFAVYKMKIWVALALFLMAMCIMLVHARMVAQSGVYITQLNVIAPNILHGLGLGHVFGPQAAIVGLLHHGIFLYGSTALLSPPAIHAFRISEVFERGRRLLLPAMVVAILAGMAASGWTSLHMAYDEGAANFDDTWGQMNHPKNLFSMAHEMTEQPSQYSPARWLPFGVGIVLTGFVMFMRARFYWWPIHAIGLLGISNWHIDRMWLPFLLGWLIKVSLMKFTSGRAVRQARFFFIALILVEAFVGGVSTIVATLTRGAVPGF